jgi:transposase InsO family protein
MYMSYTTNPKLPKLRMEAVRLVKYRDWSTREVSRYTGFNQSTIVRWCAKDPTGGWRYIPTLSSRPHSHPHALSKEIVEAIISERLAHNRCAEVIHAILIQREISVSLSSVKRTLTRHGLIRKRSPWKRWHFSEPRPEVEKPGDLVQIDTLHVLPGELYVYVLLDVNSRWAQAEPSERVNTHRSFQFVRKAQKFFPFSFSMLQSDHGSEFSQNFSERIGISHRHSRVRKPSDNGHVERFIRTLQEECLNLIPRKLKIYRKEISDYLYYYNHERPHMALQFKTPHQVMRSY